MSSVMVVGNLLTKAEIQFYASGAHCTSGHIRE